MIDRRTARAAVALAAVLLAGCAATASDREITLQYLDRDYVVYRVEAGGQGSYEQRRFDKAVYQSGRLYIDDVKLEAFLELAEQSHFFTLPQDLDELPEPPRGSCDPSLAHDPGCEPLEVIEIASDCGPHSRLRISDGERSHEISWSCSKRKGERLLAPLLDAMRGLFADQPTVRDAPPVRGWRR